MPADTRPGTKARELALRNLNTLGSDWAAGFARGLVPEMMPRNRSEDWREGYIAGRHLSSLCADRDRHCLVIETARNDPP